MGYCYFKTALNYLLILSFLLISFNCFGSPSGVEVIKLDECQEKEGAILKNSGSLDAPVLHSHASVPLKIINFQLYWEPLKNAVYYQVEECRCPDFSITSSKFTVYGSSFIPDVTNYVKYFRVRAFYKNSTTGWSNVCKYYF